MIITYMDIIQGLLRSFIAIGAIALVSFVIRLLYSVLYEYKLSDPPTIDVCYDITGKKVSDHNYIPFAEEYINLYQTEIYDQVYKQKQLIEDRMKTEKQKIRSSWLVSSRKQYYINKINAIDFESINILRINMCRVTTRYRQVNYSKYSYKVNNIIAYVTFTYSQFMTKYHDLQDIGFSTTLNKYYSDNQRSLMTRELREYIKQRDNYTCQICGKYMPDEVGLQIDHIIPVSKGGKTVPSNLQVLCSKCNGNKSNKIGSIKEEKRRKPYN